MLILQKSTTCVQISGENNENKRKLEILITAASWEISNGIILLLVF